MSFYMDNNEEEILNCLEPLLRIAEKQKKWFFSHYQKLWFSPQKFRENHKKGKFIWNFINWELIDPNEKIKYIQEEIEDKKRELQDFIEEVEKSGIEIINNEFKNCD